jgi:hypothetical protein
MNRDGRQTGKQLVEDNVFHIRPSKVRVPDPDEPIIIGCHMYSWASDGRIVSQLSRLEYQISLKESNLHSQWKKLKEQILERKCWKPMKNINVFQIVGMDQMN